MSFFYSFGESTYTVRHTARQKDMCRPVVNIREEKEIEEEKKRRDYCYGEYYPQLLALNLYCV